MSKERYEIDEQTGEILDNHIVMTPEDIVDRLNYLEEQLKNAIVPKFQVGQKVWTEWKGMIVELKIKSLYWDINQGVEYRLKGNMYLISRWEDEIFATKEEAEAKLKEIKNE